MMGSKIPLSIWIIFIITILVQCFIKFGEGDTLTSMEIEKLEKPERPRVFTSPEELKAYLGALARYYATVSRNRFGKRSPLTKMLDYGSEFVIPQPSSSYQLQSPHQPPQIFDIYPNSNDK